MKSDTPVAELVAQLQALGVTLRPDGERLRFRVPPGALTPDERNALVRRKGEILAWLRQDEGGAPAGAFPHLFSPLTLGPLTLRNRMVLSPMEVDFGAADGSVTPRTVEYYAARARGGVGLVVVEATCVDAPVGRLSPHQLVIDRDEVIPGFETLTRAVQGHGAAILLQLQHAGRKTSAALTGHQPVAPSAVASHSGEVPRALTVEEIQDLVQRYAAAAARAQLAGFDGVEIHAAHGYLLAQFISPTYNRREDAYGGSVEGRARILIEIVEATRRRVGRDFPIFVRLSALEYEALDTLHPQEDGLTLDQTRQIARWLETAGVTSIDVSATLVGQPRMHPMGWPEGQLVPMAEAIRREVDIPVSVTSRVTPEHAEELLRDDRLDLVTFGRALLADPDLPTKLAEGRHAEAVPCIYCNACLDPALRLPAALCVVNPALGHEGRAEPPRPTDPGRVWVVGGGPAGLATARETALRGFTVDLFEAGNALGGQLRVASKMGLAGETWHRLLTFFHGEMERLGVRVHLDTPWTPDRLGDPDGPPDALVIATGSRPSTGDLDGAGDPRVVQAVDLFMPPGPMAVGGPTVVDGSTVVIGGGQVGCETALALADSGARVTLVERGYTLADDAVADLVTHLRWALEASTVEVLNATEAVSIGDGDGGEGEGFGVLCRNVSAAGRVPRHVPAARVVLAVGQRTAGEFPGLESRHPRVFRVGDHRGSGGLRQALADGHRTALSLVRSGLESSVASG